MTRNRNMCRLYEKGMPWMRFAVISLCGVLFFSNLVFAGISKSILKKIQTKPDNNNTLTITLDFNDSTAELPIGFMTQNPNRLILDFKNVEANLSPVQFPISQVLLRSYDIAQTQDKTRLVFDLTQPAVFQTKKQGNQLLVTIKSDVPPIMAAPVPIPVNHSVGKSTALNSTQMPIVQPDNALQGKGESAQKKVIENRDLISLNFQDIKVRSILQLLAQFTGTNIVASESVNGSLTLHLENIPWREALDIILQTQNLGKKKIGSVLYIAPAKELASQEKQELEAAQQIQDLGALSSDLVQIKYGKAADIAALLKSQNGGTLLSSRGNVSVDSRTNTIWVQDVPTRLVEIRKLIRKLDVPVKQVLIEARIVNINSNFAQEMGVRFGVTKPNHISGTLLGADSTNAGLIPVGANANVYGANYTDRLNVDLPAVGGATGSVASIGIALARLGSGTLLDLELSAMESEGEGQVISSPRVVTADQQAAVIKSGKEIPYQESTSSGATNVAFKNAVLSLSVTPQITPDGKVNLTLKVNQDKANFSQTVNNVPSIDTRSIETQVMVDNGQTIVLGGIYETTDGKTIKRVPFLSSLPVVGGLFRNTVKTSERQELLIFITPKVIKQSQIDNA